MKAKRTEVKDGNIVVPIYEFSDGRFCVDATIGKERKRLTRASFAVAQSEARKLIAEIKSVRAPELLLTIPEAEDYRAAKRKLEPFEVSLLSVVEDWISARGQTKKLVPCDLPQVVEEFLTAKQLQGVSNLHLVDRRSRLRKFAAEFTGRIDRITTAEVESWLGALGGSRRTASNYRDALLQLFRFARLKHYLPRNEPVVIEEINVGKTGEGEIQIYTSAELKLLLTNAPDSLLTFISLGAFAGLRSEEIMRLEWKDLRLEQGFIEVSAAKAKTASRRLTPIMPVLLSWLLPLKRSTGRVIEYNHNAGLIRRESSSAKLESQKRGL